MEEKARCASDGRSGPHRHGRKHGDKSGLLQELLQKSCLPADLNRI